LIEQWTFAGPDSYQALIHDELGIVRSQCKTGGAVNDLDPDLDPFSLANPGKPFAKVAQEIKRDNNNTFTCFLMKKATPDAIRNLAQETLEAIDRLRLVTVAYLCDVIPGEQLLSFSEVTGRDLTNKNTFTRSGPSGVLGCTEQRPEAPRARGGGVQPRPRVTVVTRCH
jgi:hypothetical protein